MISEFNIEIKYRPGHQNLNADAWSRSPVDSLSHDDSTEIVQVGSIDSYDVSNTENEEMKLSQRQDPDLVPTIKYLEEGIVSDGDKKSMANSEKFVLVDDVLHRIGDGETSKLQVCVPNSSRLELMKSSHAGSFAGHFSPKALYKTLSQKHWWKGMYRDIYKFCRSCLTCASYKGTSRWMKPPLIPIPVGGPFHRVGVDIMELPLTVNGNKYVIVFVDYLTKWVEAFPAPDQTAETIAKLLIDHIICRHGVPEELLSDRGANLLSTMILEICKLTGMKKLNTTSYHPQTDVLVENFNRTLRAMIAKYCETYGTNWDEYLQRLLFAYRTKVHETTNESPFFLLYGRDARIPTESTLDYQKSPYLVDCDDYKIELMDSLSEAWRVAKQNIASSQNRQKTQHDNRATKKVDMHVGDRVMVYRPHETTGKQRKLARPYFGPYRVMELHPNGVTVRPVDKPKDPTIRVNIDRVTLCPQELPNTSWLGPKRCSRRKSSK